MVFTKNDNIFVKHLDELIYNKYCLISNEKLLNRNTDTIRLACGHSFKYNILVKAIRNMNRNKFGVNRCPYCMSSIGKIPIVLNHGDFCKISKKIKRSEQLRDKNKKRE